MATPTVIPKQSLIDKIGNLVYLDYVLKVGGIILFAVSFFYAWHHIGFLQKAGFIAGPIMWFVGARFNRVYR